MRRLPSAIDPAGDPFAAGNEDRTPPELYAVRPDGGAPDSPGWTVRVVPNLYPALSRTAATRARAVAAPAATRRELFIALPATGSHEVIVNGPQPVLSLAELPLEQVLAAVEVWRERMRVHAASAYVQLIVNERREAGASLAAHPRPAVRARLRPRRGRARARARGRLHDPHDGPEPARRPRR